MVYIPNDTSSEPEMRFEGLARYAFDCERGGGPNNIAEASVFDKEFIPSISKNGLKIIKEILEASIQKTNGNIKDLIILNESLKEEGIEQETGIKLIDYIIGLIKE